MGRWVLIAAALVVSVLTSCSAGGSSNAAPREDSPAQGSCDFDYEAELSLVDWDGSKLWSVEVPPGFHQLAPQVGGGVVVHSAWAGGSSPGTVLGLDLVDGSPRWELSVADGVRAAQLLGDALVVMTRLGLLGIDPQDGSALWEWRADGELGRPRREDQPSPVSDGSSVFVNDDGTVRAVSLDNGSEVWSLATSSDASFAPAIDTDGELVFQALFEGRILAIDSASGEVQWEWTAASGVRLEGRPALAHRLWLLLREGGPTRLRAWLRPTMQTSSSCLTLCLGASSGGRPDRPNQPMPYSRPTVL